MEAIMGDVTLLDSDSQPISLEEQPYAGYQYPLAALVAIPLIGTIASIILHAIIEDQIYRETNPARLIHLIDTKNVFRMAAIIRNMALPIFLSLLHPAFLNLYWILIPIAYSDHCKRSWNKQAISHIIWEKKPPENFRVY